MYPLYGVAANSGNGSNGFALITGQGGYIRESGNGGQAWINAAVQGTSWRLQDVVFTSLTRGYLVGQSRRIARSLDGGANFDQMDPPPGGGDFLNAIAVASDGMRGIAVGDTLGAMQDALPAIYRNTDLQSTPAWNDVTKRTDLTAEDHRDLRDVTWAGGTHFWAAGDAGLIVWSTNDGLDWFERDFSSIDPLLPQFDIASLAFDGTSSGVFVGRRPQTIFGAPKGGAWRYEAGALTEWLDVTPATPDLHRLTAVTVAGSTAWAVGEQISPTTGERQGVVLFSNHQSGGFGTFAAVQGFAPALCTLGGDLDSVPPPPILSAVAVDPNGDVWVGGACGVVFKGSGGGTTWTPVNSHTASHVRSISIVPDGTGFRVFLGCYRKGEETQVITVY